ncbi:accessory Sec system glycosyltransferase Asp1 [Limosilactobacillus sp. STM2_1]|uniref:Accessory Sec system glycosyltransferase Asp1 n=1 Tax=Limosilactobacillus rudii TaxID=2759755 RepID=A0A7W3UJ82_9LACO|nr:accessory Sec system glycosyltransferase Asp1 [Limosilactobacillus rudii]MBB1078371.1 accessory Sec system glycosyltransferase Asp1 [Limosilactobacillus rudii]MBB1096501.1 accessory Sec system glycosyltransferase Asp1 [Limosilactobacillus rudii]MCD7134302.1 accessory Sec system glycosyltransferase Asp1 [Limosilactobacillus rudii]
MYFFVNQYLLSSNSSVEHAELKRLALFKKYNAPVKLVTRDFDPVIHKTIKKFNIDDAQLVNMYDFFAQTTAYQGKVFHIEDLNLPIAYQVGTGNNYREVKDGDRLVCEVHFAAGTIGQVNHVDYFDIAGNMTLRQKYDIRGFKAVDEFFGEDGQMYYARYYRPDQQVYLERYFVKSVENTPINSLNVLRDYKGKDWFFDTLEDLFTFFLDELNKENGENNIFIADRPAVAIKPVQEMTTAAKKFLWLPMNQVNDGQDLLTGPLNSMLIGPVTTNADKWDGIIVMTEKQATILRQQINNTVPIYVINGTPISTEAQPIKMDQRTPGQLIYVGRLAEDKQTSQLINIFAQVHQQVPESKLTLYGYGTAQDVDNYKKQVEKLGLADVIDFAGYQVQLAAAYDQAQLFVDTSRIDAQPLAMGEALNHGVPVVSYDYLYGPAEMIIPGQNGELVPLNDQSQFIQTVTRLLRNQNELQHLSDGAYEHRNKLAAEKTWQQWQQLSSI